jgi:hypothetical protein
VLDVIPEVEEEEDHVARRLTTWKEENELMSKMNMVFAVGITGDMRIGYAFFFPLPSRHFDDGIFRYKYVPSLIKEILFPSPQPSPPPRKRRRIEDADMDSSPDNNSNNGVELQRSLILETVKESYLLSPSVDSPESGEGRKYDICLILESEVVVEVDPVVVDGGHPVVVVDDVVMGDVVPQAQRLAEGAAQMELTTSEGQPTEAVSSSGHRMDSKTEDANSKTETSSNTVEPPKDSQLPAIGATSPHSKESSLHPPATTDPSLPKVSTDVPRSASSAPEDHPPTTNRPAAPDSSLVPSKENEKVPAHQPVQVLQRNLTESMFRFTWEGVKIVERSSESDGVETEWAIQVCNWKWAAPALR